MAKGKRNFVFFTSFIMKYKHTLDFVGDSLGHTRLIVVLKMGIMVDQLYIFNSQNCI